MTPRRDDETARWLKFCRDIYDPQEDQWYAIDLMLDEYRLCADLGRPLQDAIDGKVHEGHHD